MTMSFDHHRPIYLQIKEHLYNEICRKERLPGEKLPSVRELAVEAGVNPNTVSRTYMEMERENVVVSKRGQGTFVTETEQVLEKLRITLAKSQTDDFLASMGKLGLTKEAIINLIHNNNENWS